MQGHWASAGTVLPVPVPAEHALANRLERSGLTGELARDSDRKRSRVLTQTHVIAA
jgi:hypothetical protein